MQNWHDGLWDIPIKKSINHYAQLPTPKHTGLYAATTLPTHHQSSNDYTLPKCICSTLHQHSLPPLSINTLPPLNKCTTIIEKQLQQDNLADTQDTIVSQPSINIIIQKNETKSNLINFLHAACFVPVKSTWLKAIKNNHFATWPGLTPTLVWKHLIPSITMAKGHLRQEYKKVYNPLK